MKVRVCSLMLFAVAVGACSSDPQRNANSIVTGIQSDMAVASDAGDMGDVADVGEDTSTVDAAPDMTLPEDTGVDLGVDMCVPETDADMCARYNFECGLLNDLDNCGVMREIENCGASPVPCAEPLSCGGGGAPGQCGCTPESCESLGVLCGAVDDTCGGTLNCDLFCVDQISAGETHNCAIGSGSMKCWGNGSDGALGTGSTTAQKNPADVMGLTSTVSQVAAGAHHTCVVDSATRVLCWGKNDRSQLGIGTTVNSNLPGTPAVFSGADQVVAGTEHTCARSGGKLECWGSNEFGQVGDPSFNINANIGVPSPPVGLDAGVVAVSAGSDHTCVIQDEGGQTGLLKCWGRNQFAQVAPLPVLGQMGGFDFWGYPTNPGWDLSSLVNQPTVVNDAAGQPFTGVKAVAAGRAHTCIIDSTDKVQCWGYMPGFDPATSCPAPDGKVPRECSIFPRTQGVLIGKLTIDGTALQTIDAMPIANVPNEIPTMKTPIELAAGDDHHCMRVSDPDANAGNIYCWGNSAFGQIGDGTNNHWPDPRLVITDTDGDFVLSTQIDLGGQHSCALVDNSNINCWGSNAKSQIGNSDLMRDESYRPFDVRLEYTP